tara:strand:+ start:140 stop:496 length:357 start_codon:yes stop_codon:yes gene_type:complete
MIKLSNLNSDIEFKKLLKLKKIHNNYFTIYFGKIYTDDINKKLKISFVAKKKIGNAVKRNKIKRKLRSAVQKNLNKNIIKKKNYAYLMIARSQTYKEKFSVISEQINKTFEKIEKIIN